MNDLPVIRGAARRSAADAWSGWVLCATLVLGAAAFSFSLRTFTHAKEAVFAGGVMLMALGLLLRGGVSWRGLPALLPLWLGLLVSVFAGLFAGTARLPAALLEEAVRITVLLLLGFLAYDLAEQRAWRRRIRAALLLSSVVVSVLGVLQFTGLAHAALPVMPGMDQPVYSVFGNQDFFGGYIALGMALSLGMALRRGRGGWWAVAALALLAPGLVVSSSRSAWLAAAAGMLAAVAWAARSLDWRRGAVAAVLLLGIGAGGMALYPGRTIERLVYTFAPSDESGHLRLWFWSGAALMVRDHPVRGVGLGNYGYWSPWYQGLALRMPNGHLHAHNELHTVHVHNEPLEILAETGLLGAAFLAWMLLRLLRRSGPEWAGLTALFVFLLFNSALHSPPFGAAAVLLAVLLLARGPRIPLTARDSAPLALGMNALAAGLAAAVWWTVLAPSYLLTKAEDAHVARAEPVPYYEAATAHPWPNYAAREQYAMALLEQGALNEAREQILLARGGLDTGRVHLLLGRLSLALGDAALANDAMQRVIWRWPANAEAWRVLYYLGDEKSRAALLEHARKWGMDTPGGGADAGRGGDQSMTRLGASPEKDAVTRTGSGPETDKE